MGKIIALEYDTLWTKTYGGSWKEGAYAVAVDKEGHYVVTGYTYTYAPGNSAVWVLKINPSNGETLWTKVYGDIGWFTAYSVAVDSSNNYIVVGTQNNDTLSDCNDVLILKLEPTNGDIIWAKSYGGVLNDEAHGVAVDNEGYYIVTGFTYSYGARDYDFWVLKIDPNTGDTLWSKIYGGPGEDESFDISIDKDGNYLVAGYYDTLSYQVWVLKLNKTNGEIISQGKYGGYYNTDLGYSIDVDKDSNYVVVGYTTSVSKGREFLVLRINHLTWDTLWMRTFGGDSNEYAKDVKVNQEGDYIVVGYTRSFGGNSSNDNYWILKIDPLSGETLWTKLYEGITGIMPLE